MLNPDGNIILTGIHGENKLLVSFHPEPGNYEVHLPPTEDIGQGSEWSFVCPVCHENLTTNDNEKLCSLNLNEDGETKQVLFSRIAGEKATFVVSRTETKALGPHANNYDEYLMHVKYIKV